MAGWKTPYRIKDPSCVKFWNSFNTQTAESLIDAAMSLFTAGADLCLPHTYSNTFPVFPLSNMPQLLGNGCHLRCQKNSLSCINERESLNQLWKELSWPRTITDTPDSLPVKQFALLLILLYNLWACCDRCFHVILNVCWSVNITLSSLLSQRSVCLTKGLLWIISYKVIQFN